MRVSADQSFGMKRNETSFWNVCKLLKKAWPGTESNRRRQPFQGCLPTMPSGPESSGLPPRDVNRIPLPELEGSGRSREAIEMCMADLTELDRHNSSRCRATKTRRLSSIEPRSAHGGFAGRFLAFGPGQKRHQAGNRARALDLLESQQFARHVSYV